jgi:hypothetical protein
VSRKVELKGVALRAVEDRGPRLGIRVSEMFAGAHDVLPPAANGVQVLRGGLGHVEDGSFDTGIHSAFLRQEADVTHPSCDGRLEDVHWDGRPRSACHGGELVVGVLDASETGGVAEATTTKQRDGLHVNARETGGLAEATTTKRETACT